MKKRLFLLATAAVFAIVTACAQRNTVSASDRYITKTVEGITDFNAINVSGIADVVYTQAVGAPAVSVYCSDNVYEYLEISVKNGTLMVGIRNGIAIRGEHKIKVSASSAALETVEGSGVNDIELRGEIKSDNFQIMLSGSRELDADNIICKTFTSETSGSGGIDIDKLTCDKATVSSSGSSDADISWLACTDVEVSASGSGEIDINGTAVNATLSTSGSTEIDAEELSAENVTASSSGSSGIKCRASKSISASTSGSSRITYYGRPPQTDLKGKANNIKSM